MRYTTPRGWRRPREWDPDRITCHTCRAKRVVVGTRDIDRGDPTTVYLMSCGHVTA